MMPGMQGLTGGREQCRILLGKEPIFDNTKDGLLRVKFDGAFGINDPERLKFATWRHCIAYAKQAENIKGAHTGTLVSVSGWIATESDRDEQGNPVLIDEKPKLKEWLICLKAEIVPDDTWKNKEKQIPLGVDQATITK